MRTVLAGKHEGTIAICGLPLRITPDATNFGPALCESAAGWRGFLRGPRPVGVTAASWCGSAPGVALARPPAVAAIGLRRSGRIGNSESPSGRIAPAYQVELLISHPMAVRGSAPGMTRAARFTARWARP
jgi:hypothetical protein